MYLIRNYTQKEPVITCNDYTVKPLINLLYFSKFFEQNCGIFLILDCFCLYSSTKIYLTSTNLRSKQKIIYTFFLTI